MSSESDDCASYLEEGECDYFEYEHIDIGFEIVEKNETAIAQQQKGGVQVDIEFLFVPRLFVLIPLDYQEKLEKPHHGCRQVAIVHQRQVLNSVTIKPHHFSNFRNFRSILLGQVVPTWPLQTPWYSILVKKFWYKLRAIANRMSPNHHLLCLKVIVHVFGRHYLVKESVFHCILQESIHDANGVVPASPISVQLLLRERIEEEDYNNVKEEKACSICLDELSKRGCEVAYMPCSHMFHPKCIEQWLSKSCYCPLCRWQMPMFFDFCDRPRPLLGLQHNLTTLGWFGLS